MCSLIALCLVVPYSPIDLWYLALDLDFRQLPNADDGSVHTFCMLAWLARCSSLDLCCLGPAPGPNSADLFELEEQSERRISYWVVEWRRGCGDYIPVRGGSETGLGITHCEPIGCGG